MSLLYWSDFWGSLHTVIETAKINGLNPEVYLKKILSKIQDYNSQKVADLLPWNIISDTS
jgi:hypothetical protein